VNATKTKDPELVAWLAQQTWSEFAQSLAGQCGKWGFSEKQLASANSMRQKCAENQAKKMLQAAIGGSGLDLAALPAGRYGVPHTDETNRLKVRIDKPVTGKWAGWMFVKDAAEYGFAKRYGKQAPGGTYIGDIVPELQAILADPAEAAAKYWALTGNCMMCNRHLEAADSVKRGLGPVCAGKVGW